MDKLLTHCISALPGNQRREAVIKHMEINMAITFILFYQAQTSAIMRAGFGVACMALFDAQSLITNNFSKPHHNPFMA